MSDTSERYRKVAATFTERVANVPPDGWDGPTPCEGWATRDIVQHVVDTSTYFLGQVNLGPPEGPSVDDDPLGAWIAVRDAVQVALEDVEIAARSHDSPLGSMSFEHTVGLFGVGDALVHTWDLARATGQDESLDPTEVSRMLAGMQQFDQSQMRQSGAFGPAVDVPSDADEQTRLIAFTGRRP